MRIYVRVHKSDNGKWVVTKNGEPEKTFNTKREAVEYAAFVRRWNRSEE